MSLVRYQAFNPLGHLQRDVARLFNERSDVVTSDWSPLVDIKEFDDKFVLHADVPGVDPKEIDVSMDDGVLTIKGKREIHDVEERDNYKRIERYYGSFHRRFSLPDTANSEGISAEVRDGVLSVEIPKLEKVQPRRIEVKH